MGRMLGWGRATFASGSPARLLIAGACVTLAVASLATAVALGLVVVTASLGWIGVLMEALALKSMLSLRGLARSALAVGGHLARADLSAARAAVGRDLVSRATATLDAGQTASAAVESVAENLTDAFVAPVVCFLALGLPGAVLYRVVNTADAMIGYRDGDLLYFGRLAARLDDVLNLVPARLAAISLVAAALVVGVDARRALATMRRDHGRTASPNAGWTMAATAGALAVVLEKPGAYRLGEGRPPRPDDIRRAVALVAVAAALTLTAAAAVGLIVASALGKAMR